MRSICSWLATRSCSSRSASAPNGPAAAVHEEAGAVARQDHRACPSPRRSPAPRASARSPVWSARITSSSSISGGGLKKCMPDDVLGPRRGARQRGDRDRRGVGGEHRVGAADLREARRTARASARAARARPRSRARSRARPSSASAVSSAPAASAAIAALLDPALEAAARRRSTRARAPRAPGRAAATRMPAAQPSCAMPAPIVPAPTTPSVRGRVRAHRPRNSGLRFSRNACMPSTRSSVAMASSNRRRSWSSPALERASRRRPARPAWPAGPRAAAAAPPPAASSSASRRATPSAWTTWFTRPSC